MSDDRCVRHVDGEKTMRQVYRLAFCSSSCPVGRIRVQNLHKADSPLTACNKFAI